MVDGDSASVYMNHADCRLLVLPVPAEDRPVHVCASVCDAGTRQWMPNRDNICVYTCAAAESRCVLVSVCKSPRALVLLPVL